MAVARTGDRDSRHSPHQALDFLLKLSEGSCIGTPLCPDDDVPRSYDSEQVQPDELTESTLEPVAIDCRVSVTRHYETHTQVCQRGRTHPNQQIGRSESLPLASDTIEIRSPAQPSRARETARARLPRTSTAA